MEQFSFPEDLSWLVLLLPLLSAIVITLFTRRDARLSSLISVVAVCLSFVGSLGLFLAIETSKASSTSFDWLVIPEFSNLAGQEGIRLVMSLIMDKLSMLMLLVVTGVGAAIHVYSMGYMKEDPCCGRFFASLSLFMFSMIGIVLSSSFVMMFIFWELVGVSSYLLIGFWYERPAAADAAKKAFITNRLGDFGFILGILMIWAGTQQQISFESLEMKLGAHPGALGALTSVAGLLIFCGAVGKSAQFPLHVWLPDAMEGPTPVSALIHAATMVAAGVYMICRVFFLLAVPAAWPGSLSFMNGMTALDVIAIIGGFTALLAALIAVQQNDIKRILAYSTLSQLGYMVMAVGLSTAKTGPTPAMYHLITHAFFKALLFLGAGSVIMALHHEQDIWKMGGLRKKMPITWWTFLIGMLALCGVPPLSGFFSKDGILELAFHHNKVLFGVAVFTAILTTFYMFRLFFVALTGKERSHAAGHAHESPLVMTIPLILLAIASAIGGFLGIESRLGAEVTGFHPFAPAPLCGLAAVVIGFSAALFLYKNAEQDPLPGKLGPIARAMANRFYFDELYALIIQVTHEFLSHLAYWLDRWFIEGFCVRGAQVATQYASRGLRLAQSGNLQVYALMLILGVLILLWIVMGKIK